MDSPLIKNVNLFLDDKPSVYALREKAKQILLSTGFPTNKTEAWKYTNVSPIIKSDFNISTEEQKCSHDCCHHQSSPFIELHFCKGKLHIEDYDLPHGLNITPLPLSLYEDEYKKYLFKSFDAQKHPFAALNGMYTEQGLCINVEKDCTLSTPIYIKYNQKDCENLQLNIHNLIIVENNAHLEIIEDFSSDNKPAKHLTNVINEIYLKKDSSLTHYKIQKEQENAYHLALNSIKQQENSQYKQFYLSDGAKISRQETLINLDHRLAKAEIYTAYKAKKDCLTDITTNINHISPETFSNQYAKSVLEDSSTAVFQGKIHIAKDADKTAGHQLHKALYLSDYATLNCKPELEIYADDVKCSHGASSGEIDKEQLFYLLSRGIDKESALNLLTQAHLDEIISMISNEEIQKLFVFSK